MSLTPRFHPLRVADLRRETEDAVSIALEVPPALAPAYRFEPGQYLTLRRMVRGEELRRSYSICSGPGERLRIAVKRLEGGLFSAWAQEGIRPGDVLDVMTPAGRFGQAARQRPGRVQAGFAAGSGITPILSILRFLLATTAETRFFLFYGNRSGAGILFHDALEDLKNRHLGRLAVFYILSREEQDVPLLGGRLDGDKVRRLLRHVVPAATIDHAYVCGPDGMIEEVGGALHALAIGPERVHVERFVSALGGRPRAAVPPAATPPAAHAWATLVLDGRRREVPVAEGETVLAAALRAGLDLPYACRGGMCSTCRARVAEGAAEMAVNFSLEPWELAAGFVLTCQARPTTPRIVVDFDQV